MLLKIHRTAAADRRGTRVLTRRTALTAGALLLYGAASASPPDPLEVAAISSEPDRRLTFTTREGSWMSVDVTPDGSTLLFDLLGDVYRVSAEGGRAEVVLGGAAFESQPVVSPDGKRIAFVSDRSGSENLWVADMDGADPRQLSRSADKSEFASPAWSPDGRSVFVSRRMEKSGVFEMLRFDLGGGAGVAVTPQRNGSKPRDQRLNAIGAAPSPDGRHLYFAQKTGEQWDHLKDAPWRVMRLDLRSGEQIALIDNGLSAMRPQVARDGQSLIYAARLDSRTGLRVRDLHSGADRWLTDMITRDAQDSGYSRDLVPRFDMSSDGRFVYTSAAGRLWRISLADGATSPIPFEAPVDLALAPALERAVPAETGPVQVRIVQEPRLSPDGSSIAFSALGKVYVMSLADGRPRRLTRNGRDVMEFQPAWSPDGRWIAYVTGAAAGGHVHKVRPGRPATDQRLTPTAGFFSEPQFAPDGETVYALHSSAYDRMLHVEEVGPNRLADLVRLPAEGGDFEVLTRAGQGARRPYFTESGKRVYFTTPDGAVSVNREGGDRTVHFEVHGPFPWNHRHEKPVPMEDIVLSPDERWALVRAGHQLHLLARPPAGDATGPVNLLDTCPVHCVQVSEVGADYFAWRGQTILWSLGASVWRLSLEGWNSGEPLPPAERFDVGLEVPRDVHGDSLLLRGATVLTMGGAGAIDDADLLITGNRIAAVGAAGSVEAPQGTDVLDLSGRTVVPGFVDTHAHWYEARRDVLLDQQWSFTASLAYGITSGLDVQGMDQDMFVYQDMIDAGYLPGPRAYTVGKGMFSDNRLENADDVRQLLLRYRDYYRTRNVKAYVIGNRRIRRMVAATARELGMVVTTEGMNDAKIDITHAIDGFAGNEHYLALYPLHGDIVELFARSGIGYTPTLLLSAGGPAADDVFFIRGGWHDDAKVRRFFPHSVLDNLTTRRQFRRADEQVYPQVARDARRIMRRGGRVGVGSHGQFQGVSFHWEMQGFAAGGWKPEEILRAATIVGADILGRADQLGSIEAGKLADLVILGSDPRQDITLTLDIEQVVKNGRLYDAADLDEVWPRQQPLPAPWFHDEAYDPPVRASTTPAGGPGPERPPETAPGRG